MRLPTKVRCIGIPSLVGTHSHIYVKELRSMRSEPPRQAQQVSTFLNDLLRLKSSSTNENIRKTRPSTIKVQLWSNNHIKIPDSAKIKTNKKHRCFASKHILWRSLFEIFTPFRISNRKIMPQKMIFTHLEASSLCTYPTRYPETYTHTYVHAPTNQP